MTIRTYRGVRSLLFVIAFIALLCSASITLAQEATTTPVENTPKPQITFPVVELGGCETKEACRAYCEVEANREACVAWGETHGLMKPQEAQKARQILKIKGPGGCASLRECRTYCEIQINRQECMDFAKNNSLISPIEQKIHELITSGKGPGGCESPEACRAYCEIETNREECRSFAKDNQLPPPKMMGVRKERLGNSGSSTTPSQLRGKIQELLAENPGPGGCTTVDECKTYCADAKNSEACITFARAHQLMTGKEADRAAQITREVGPGGCRGIECREYCANDANTEECLTFAQSRGIMSADEVRGARTLLIEGGPGGCKSPEECRHYCEDPVHSDECHAFAQQHGFLQQREVRQNAPQIQVDRTDPTKKPTIDPRVRCRDAGGSWDGKVCVGMKNTTNRPNAPINMPTTEMPGGPRAQTPEERCKIARGTWDGSRCTLPNPAGARPYMGTAPIQDGVLPRRDGIETRCANAGGTWDGVKCIVPPRGSPPPIDPVSPIPLEGPASLAPYSPFAAAVASLFVPFFR
jgi:hypothetical protein